MFGNALSGTHLIILLVVVLLLFGAPKLPGLAKSIGQSMKILKKEVSDLSDDKRPASPPAGQAAPSKQLNNANLANGEQPDK
ncbi:twin-arginine translocase TatA/TatE family subunit [Canibacter sp. lx-72]|uniref:twin-arginine translocase TatA/TatE family subunit n=1 Tax=Canibacter zhuwentaonis TaxID=2837491 RepID=UPI001BDDBB4E|nr:twin-arginine translocase TatA/TatE family subunit [Canibacter zhuwentaonis]MBT1018287.1 twin-arginine translocase TatA/TatE family subunit [Canibacter zhuwentaonis]MBT1035474.1 twin-arginine translocase TatA/TatE family subunit [Canibacter zhuwentaonis]